jgi:hypothetical protein
MFLAYILFEELGDICLFIGGSLPTLYQLYVSRCVEWEDWMIVGRHRTGMRKPAVVANYNLFIIIIIIIIINDVNAGPWSAKIRIKYLPNTSRTPVW